MKANYTKSQQQKCAKCKQAMCKVVNDAAEGFALIYLLRFIKSLNKVYHHGEIMIGKVLKHMLDTDDEFSKDLEDGVASTKLIEFAKKYGIEIEDVELEEIMLAGSLAEKGIGWHKKRRRGNRKSRIEEGVIEE